MQPLPVLTDAQVNVVGPLQLDGRFERPDVIDRLDAAFPSLVVKVTLNAALAPIETATALEVDAVATTELSDGVAEVPLVVTDDPLLLDPQMPLQAFNAPAAPSTANTANRL